MVAGSPTTWPSQLMPDGEIMGESGYGPAPASRCAPMCHSCEKMNPPTAGTPSGENARVIGDMTKRLRSLSPAIVTGEKSVVISAPSSRVRDRFAAWTSFSSVTVASTSIDNEADRDRDDDQDPADDVLPVVRDGEQVEAVRDHGQDHHAEDRAPDRADSAEDAGAAEASAGDREQRQRAAKAARVTRPRPGHRRVEQAGEAAGGTGDHEGEDHDPVHFEAREPGRIAVVADAVEVAAENGVGQHELEDDRD